MKIDKKRYPLSGIRKLLKKQGDKLGVTKVEDKDDQLIISQSEQVRVRIKEKNDQIQLSPYFPVVGNAVQMISSMLLLFVFYALGLRGSILFAIIGGQVFSLAYYFPKANTFTLEVTRFIKKEL